MERGVGCMGYMGYKRKWKDPPPPRAPRSTLLRVGAAVDGVEQVHLVALYAYYLTTFSTKGDTRWKRYMRRWVDV